jgi:hypothetical protein
MFLLLFFFYDSILFEMFIPMCGAECVSYRKTARALIGCHFLFLVGEIEKKGCVALGRKKLAEFFF